MKIEPFKMRIINPQQSKIVQETLFKNRYSWNGGSKIVEYIELEFLFFYATNLCIGVGDLRLTQCNDERYYGVNPLPEISYQTFITRYKRFTINFGR